ncbi:MAG: alanine--tRNA ligase-related protein, partial [Candidatus Binatia bacterium]|nr:alanine--tRNA ligase-related protein [Candidatus Binatia bacterium]
MAREIAQDEGFSLDMEGFQRAMEQQRKMARQAWKGTGEEETRPIHQELAREIGETPFLGYETVEAKARVSALLVSEQRRREVGPEEEVEIILDCSSFYGKSGGQEGDTGSLVDEEGKLLVKVTDTLKPLPQLICHRGVVLKGNLQEEQMLLTRVDVPRRQAITHSHSATHLLHGALRQVLGDHVKQAGSLVAPDRLRFDFTHFSPLVLRELGEIEAMVNEKIWENLSISTEVLPLKEAVQRGAMALFGEKYETMVRMVRMGDFSLEVCGGTHASNTGQIGLFKIIQETGIAAGVRRIEALTTQEAYRYIRQEEAVLGEIREITKAKPLQEAERVHRLWEQTREQGKELASLKDKLASRAVDLVGGGNETEEEVRTVKGIRVLSVRLDHLDTSSLRSFVDNAKVRLGSGVIVAGMVVDHKVALVGGVTEDITARVHAGKLIKAVAQVVGG